MTCALDDSLSVKTIWMNRRPGRKVDNTYQWKYSWLLGPEKIPIRYDSAEMVQDILPIINEVGNAKSETVIGLLAPLDTESEVRMIDAGALEKLMVRKPESRLHLNPRPCFGNQPHATLKMLYKIRQCLKHPRIRWRCQSGRD